MPQTKRCHCDTPRPLGYRSSYAQQDRQGQLQPGERRKKQLAENDLMPDEWGGNTMVISGLGQAKQGIEDLLEAIPVGGG